MEIEAKFSVRDRRVFVQLLNLSALGDAALLPQPGPELQHTTYYDTPTDALRSQRASLRVREVAGRRIAAVKRSHGARGGLHIRDEWETLIDAEVHPRSWPPSIAREQALTLVGGASLVARVAVHTRRHSIAVRRGGRLVAELCLDEGHVRAGGRLIGFRELEVELQGAGTGGDLAALCAWLTARFPLAPEALGKRSRGLALLDAIAAERWPPPVGGELALAR